MTDTSKPVVVGVDGTAAALRAARWAGAIAAKMGSPLRIVHAGPYPGHSLTDAAAAIRAAVIDEQRGSAETYLKDAAEAVREHEPDLAISTVALTAPVDEALVSLSLDARLIVLGSDEITTAAAMLVGSLTLVVAARSRCPVVAWRGEASRPTGQPVVVGVDGSSRVAISLAFELADALGSPLWVVHSWSTRLPAGEITVGFMIDWKALEDTVRREVTDTVAPWCAQYPDVDVSVFVDRAKPSKAILGHLAGAQLVIVGSRGRNLLASALLGSTSLNLLHHAPLPVVVCHPDGAGPRASLTARTPVPRATGT